MARKGWDALSPGYRGRLQRQGISKETYESGASLQKARGHTSAQKERAQSKDYRAYASVIRDANRFYGIDIDDAKEQLAQFPRAEVIAAHQRQKQMYDAWANGDTQRARGMWEQRDRNLPEWMNYYHFYFS